ncbi:glycosyltransferase [Microvirga sp. HBU67558]|uniref:glycosyltransferase n=1 Tax=Microvirga TaxID=186650 RepID=UPI001B3758B8|nr:MULTISPECIES: glycosyltransferase [unclassified Microvirga]MBQ0819615.1 glycosyltransferase [Microvirga sp. HBU67558]
MNNPLVSVLIPSYQHEKYIRATLESVLAQTFTDIEVVVVDDGSSDNSASIVASYRDSRIVLRQLYENVGACQAMNVGLEMCRGQYIAVCNSDDVWVADKLEKQLQIFSSGTDVAAVFSDVEWIDDEGCWLGDHPGYQDVFRQANRSRFQWMRDLLEGGNRLCHPSVLIKRDVYDKVGLYNNFYRQLPDLDMWVRVLEHFDIFVMPERLVKFRVHQNNTSRPSQSASNRSINEHRLILVDFMKRVSSDNFYKTFGFKELKSIGDPERLKIEIVNYLLEYRGIDVYERMFHQLGTEIAMTVPPKTLIDNGIAAHDFHQMVGRDSPWIPVIVSTPVDASEGSIVKEQPAVVEQLHDPQLVEPSQVPPKKLGPKKSGPKKLGPLVAETQTKTLIRIVLSRLRTRTRSYLSGNRD